MAIHKSNIRTIGWLTPKSSMRLRSKNMLLAPGMDVGEHTTHEREEIVIILKGTGRLVAGEEETPLEAGDTVYIPGEVVHNIFNSSDSEELFYLYAVALFGAPGEGDAVKEAKSEAAQEKKAHIAKSLRELKVTFDKLKIEGVVLSDMEKQVARLKEEMKNKRFDNVLKMIIDINENLEKLELQYRIADASFHTTEKKAQEINIDTTKRADIADRLREAQHKMKDGLYSPALELVLSTSTMLDEIMENYRKGTELLGALGERLETTANLGLDVGELIDKHNNAKMCLREKDYDTAISTAKEIHKLLDAIIKMENYSQREKLQSLIDKKKSAIDEKNLEIYRHLITISVKEGSIRQLEETIDNLHKAISEIEKIELPAQTAKEPQTKENENPKEKQLEEQPDEQIVDGANRQNAPEITKAEEMTKAREITQEVAAKGSSAISDAVSKTGSGAELTAIGADASEAITAASGQETNKTAIEEKKQEYTMETASDEQNHKCFFCRGRIRGGLDIVRCSCGAVYHKSCANRAQNCQNCQTVSFDIPIE